VLPVEILPVQETIVLRARGSELLILPHHVKKLKGLTKPRDFSQYFRGEALVNRPARKLFEAWLRKDHTLWPRLYQAVHKEPSGEGDGATDKGPPPSSKDLAAHNALAVERAASHPTPIPAAGPVYPKAVDEGATKPSKAAKSPKAVKPESATSKSRDSAVGTGKKAAPPAKQKKSASTAEKKPKVSKKIKKEVKPVKAAGKKKG